MEHTFTWIGIAICITQSAMFSGLNLAFFSLTRLRLEVIVEETQSPQAIKVLNLRKDSNFLLTTILWGNVGINVLLTLLTDSVLAGIASFGFSTIVITFFGEIIPQAYFSRNALLMASKLSPILRFYQFVLYPVAKPTALVLDSWLGKESISYLSEENIKMFIKKHIQENELDNVEGTGAINFLSLANHFFREDGKNINPASIINLPHIQGEVQFPDTATDSGKDFIKRINKAGEKWIIITDDQNNPTLVLNANSFLRSTILGGNKRQRTEDCCHTPLVIRNPTANLGDIIKVMKRDLGPGDDLPIDLDVVLLWTQKEKKIMSGADLLGRLLMGI